MGPGTRRSSFPFLSLSGKHVIGIQLSQSENPGATLGPDVKLQSRSLPAKTCPFQWAPSPPAGSSERCGRGLGLTRMDSNARMSSCPTAPRGVRVGRASAGGGCLRLLDHGSDTAQVLTTHWGSLLLGLRGAVFHGSSRGWADAAEGKAVLLAPGWRKAGQRGRWHHCPHQTRALKAGVSHRFRPACYPSSI